MKIFPLKVLSTQDKAQNLIKIISGEFNPEKLSFETQKTTSLVDKNLTSDKFVSKSKKENSTIRNLIDSFCNILK